MTRAQALRWYTSEAGWFTREEKELGSIEAGKLADLVVLNKDYFRVPAKEIQHLHSVFTVVGGKVAHDQGVLA